MIPRSPRYRQYRRDWYQRNKLRLKLKRAGIIIPTIKL